MLAGSGRCVRPANSDPQNPKPNNAVPTAGEILPDGTMLELVRLRNQSRLLVWRDGRARTVPRYANAGIIYEPLSLDPTALAAIRIPSKVAGYGSVGQLFSGVLGALAKFSGVPSQDLIAAAFWILASWFPELLPLLPTLIVASPSPADARKFLRLLRCFCRRGVLLTEVNSGGFLTLPMPLRPTLLLEQAQLDRRMRGLIRAATGGSYVPNRGEFLDLRCARAVACEQDDLDVDLREGSMTVCLFPQPAEVPAFDRFAEETLAAEFQSRLLRYRFKNFRKVADSTFDAPGFTTGIRDLARAFGACVIEDETLQAEIISLLSVQDGDVRATFANRPDVAIVVALLPLIHERQQRISVTGLTAFVNAVLRAGGEIREYGPLEIGRFLSRLGIPRARNAGGMVINLTRDVSLTVHLLKRRCGVVTTPTSFPGCPDCEPAGVSADRQLVQVVQEV
jgi:hypothetical protein